MMRIISYNVDEPSKIRLMMTVISYNVDGNQITILLGCPSNILLIFDHPKKSLPHNDQSFLCNWGIQLTLPFPISFLWIHSVTKHKIKEQIDTLTVQTHDSDTIRYASIALSGRGVACGNSITDWTKQRHQTIWLAAAGKNRSSFA